MRWALISTDGKSVENVIEAEQAFIDAHPSRVFIQLKDTTDVETGYLFDGKSFTKGPSLVNIETADIDAKAAYFQSLLDGSAKAALLADSIAADGGAVQIVKL